MVRDPGAPRRSRERARRLDAARVLAWLTACVVSVGGAGVSACISACASALVLAAPARAHVVVDRTALRAYLQSADLACVAEFESDVETWQSPDGHDRQDVYRVRVVETLRGDAPTERFAFIPASEGLPDFGEGDRALLFLRRTGSNPSLASMAEALPFFSEQGPGDEWALGGADGPAIEAAARRWVAWSADPENADARGLESLLLDELRSGSARLRADALAEIARLHDRPGLFGTRTDWAPFLALLRQSTIPLADRLALAHSFEGARAADVIAWYRETLTEPETPTDATAWSNDERRQLLRTVGRRDDPWAVAWSRAQLAADAPDVRREAVRALASPGRGEVVEWLEAAAADPDAGVAREAILGLGRVGTLGARQVLEAFADQAPAPVDTWAAAELRRDGSRLR